MLGYQLDVDEQTMADDITIDSDVSVCGTLCSLRQPLQMLDMPSSCCHIYSWPSPLFTDLRLAMRYGWRPNPNLCHALK